MITQTKASLCLNYKDRAMRWMLFGALALGLIVAILPANTAHATGMDALTITSFGETRTLSLGINKSMVIELPADVRDVLVSNPAVADAVVRTARRVFVIGMAAGDTNIFLFDGADRQIAVLNLTIQRDVTGIQATLADLMPGARIGVEPVNDGVILRGVVESAAQAQTAVDVATRFVGDASRVVNALQIAGGEQVQLRVTIAEVQRTALRQLGVNIGDFTGATAQPVTAGIGAATLSALTSNPFSLSGQAISNSVLNITSNGISAQIRALEQDGIVRTLAEPNLTAVSGESASFLAGGEFPVPISRDSQGNVIVEYKPFGVGLGFTPVVLAGDRISLQIETEVSELTAEGAFTLRSDSGNDLSIPGLRVRRASTMVELPSGGSIVMAGLIDQRLAQNIDGIPGLMSLPIIGQLFRSSDFQRSQTELAIFITPYLTQAVARDDLVRPDENLRPASDLSTLFFNQLIEQYGVQGQAPSGRYHGHAGFIVP
ncbi:MAG: type II and III secretion system protein family protein [Hyphomicrobiales bacterium]|jgi:pilus assembly protein CpaC